MKRFEEMTFSEQVDWATVHLCVAIGRGKFRDAVAELLILDRNALLGLQQRQADETEPETPTGPVPTVVVELEDGATEELPGRIP